MVVMAESKLLIRRCAAMSSALATVDSKSWRQLRPNLPQQQQQLWLVQSPDLGDGFGSGAL